MNHKPIVRYETPVSVQVAFLTTQWLVCPSPTVYNVGSCSLSSVVNHEAFTSLNEEQKFQVLFDLVDLCSPRERFHFQEELKTHLNRDFLSLLPPEIVIQILSYLSVDDLVSGLQVCKDWRRLISGATPVWKTAPQKMGLSESIMSAKLPKYNGSLSALTLAAWKHRKCIASSRPSLVAMDTYFSGTRNQMALRRLVDRKCDYHWAGNGVVVCHKMDASLNIDILLMTDAFSFKILCSYCALDACLQLRWAAAIGSEYLIWRNYSGNKWVKCSLKESKLSVWIDDSIREEGVAGVCDKCGLITILPSSVDQEAGLWHMSILKLIAGHKRPVKTYCSLKAPSGLWSELDAGESIIEGLDVFSIAKNGETNDFCKAHCLLVQLEGSIAVYHVLNDVGTVHIYNPTKVLQPHPCEATNGTFFQRSSDGKLVSMVSTCQHHIWQLDSGSYHSVHTPSNCCCCLALGHLYSVLQCEDSVKVVATYTGEVLFSCSIALPLVQGRQLATLGIFERPPFPRFWEPLDSRWLNDFDCYQFGQQGDCSMCGKPQSARVWHIVAVNTGVQDGQLQSIIGFY